MLELAVFIIPGFIWYFGIYRNHDFKNLDSSQWILIPLLVVCSSGLLTISKLLFWCGNWTVGLLPFEHVLSAGPALAKFENIEIRLWEFALAIALSFFTPILAERIRGRKIDLFLNPFGQFRTESALVNEITALMRSQIPVMVVLDDKRVYIGMPVEIDNRSGDLSSITLVPWMSGVTDGRLQIKTNYLEERGERLGPADFASVFPITFLLKRIMSVRGFDLRVFLDYFEKRGLVVDNEDLKRYFNRMIAARNSVVTEV